jgi:hypothetical protein
VRGRSLPCLAGKRVPRPAQKPSLQNRPAPIRIPLPCHSSPFTPACQHSPKPRRDLLCQSAGETGGRAKIARFPVAKLLRKPAYRLTRPRLGADGWPPPHSVERPPSADETAPGGADVPPASSGSRHDAHAPDNLTSGMRPGRLLRWLRLSRLAKSFSFDTTVAHTCHAHLRIRMREVPENI